MNTGGVQNGASGSEGGRPGVRADAGAGSAPGWRSDSRPRLPSKVRVRWNDPRGQALLLYPEGALALNPTAQAVLELCDGRRTVTEIVGELAGRFHGGDVAAAGRTDSPAAREGADAARNGGMRDRDGSGEESAAAQRERMQSDVIAFLERLRQRGWVADVSAL